MTNACMEDSGMIVKQYVSENDTEYLVIKHIAANGCNQTKKNHPS